MHPIRNAQPLKEIFAIFRAYIECSALENRGLRHIVEEAVWILSSAIFITETVMPSYEVGSASSSLGIGL